MKRLAFIAALCGTSPSGNSEIFMARLCLRLALIVSAVLAGLMLALAYVAPPAHAQSALEYAATGMGRAVSVAPHKVNKRFARRVMRSESMLAGVYAPLAAKAREIESACGSRVISGRRHTKVAGTRRWSLHAVGKAVDMRGNPGCIYAHLRGFSGGYSIDYGRVKHVHISLGGREDGVRFAHHHAQRTRVAWR